MLKRLRWQLTGFYLLAAVGLVALVGGGSYLLLNLYFRSTTDLAMQYKMATLFDAYALPLPPELARAEADWQASYGRARAPTPVPSPVVHQAGEDDGEENEHPASAPQKEDHSPEDAYNASLAPIFVLSIDPGGSLGAGVSPVAPSLQVNQQAAAAALQNGSDLRTIRLPDGTRLRLLTYRAPGGSAPGVIQIGRLLGDQDRILRLFMTGLGALGGLVVLALGALSWWLSWRSLGPAQRAWDQQQAFVSNASHELRTPLTLMKATAEYALRGGPQGEQKTALEDILEECDYMDRLVDDLLLLSRLDTHRLALSRELVRLTGLLADTQRSAHKLAGESGVNLVLDEAQGIIWGDPARLRQVLLILLDNALRFTPPGGSIHLASHLVGRSCQVSVADSGRGIPAEHLPHIFERFYQVRQPGDENARSNGLGLSIAKALVEAQGGRISMESQVGKGTRVILSFPAAQPAPAR